MNYQKFYIGRGPQVPNLQIAKVTLKMDLLEEIAYERDGVRYVTFEVAKLKEPDKFGRDYTCYMSKKVAEVQEPTPKKAKSVRKSKKEKTENQEIPF
jgi:hypothetical protein